MMKMDTYKRRSVLGSIGVAMLAGCSSPSGTEDVDPRALGDGDTTVEVWEDFGDQNCRTYALDVFPILEEALVAKRNVEYISRDYIEPANEWSRRMANAVRSIQVNGSIPKSYQFARFMYQNQDAMSFDLIKDVAEIVEVEDPELIVEESKGEYDSFLDSETKEGENRGISTLPGIFVDGEEVTDLQPESIVDAV